MSTKNPTAATAEPTIEQLKAQLAEANAKLAEKQKAPPVTMKVGAKGGISVYGLGRYPVSLYRSQMEKVVELAKSGKIDEFIAANADKLANKAA